MGTGKRVTFNVADDDNVAIDSLIGNPKITLTTSDENAGKIGNQLFSDRKSRRTKKSFRGTFKLECAKPRNFLKSDLTRKLGRVNRFQNPEN